MTLDEGIKHCEEVADQCEYEASRYDMSDSYESYIAGQEGVCGERHRQLAEWLRELKEYRKQEDILDKIKEEVKLLSNANPSYWHSGDMVDREEVFEIIDKYKAGGEEHLC